MRWLALLLLLTTPSAAGNRLSAGVLAPASGTAERTRDFSEFLVSRDLVVKGTLLAKHPTQHTIAGGCGQYGFAPIPAVEFSIHVDSVLFGSIPTNPITIMVYGRDSLFGDVGASVLAFGSRTCTDMEFLWGDVGIIEPFGLITAPLGEDYSLLISGSRQEPHYQQLLSALASKRDWNPGTVLAGAPGLALVRIVAFLPTGTVQVDSLQWILGVSTRVPRHLIIHYCDRVTAVGDTLLIPVFPLTDQPQNVATCAGGLTVHQGMVPAISCRMDRLSDVLRMAADGVRIIADRSR